MSRVITYPTKSATLSAVSPVLYSAQNTEVNQIYQDLNDLDAGMALKAGEATQDFAAKILSVADNITIGGNQIFPLGAKTGMRLIFNSTTTPPVIESGSVEVKGRLITLKANKTLALSDVPAGNAMIQLITGAYVWYLAIVDELGNFRWVKYFSGNTQSAYKDSGNITSMSIVAKVATVTVASTASLTSGDLIKFEGTDGGLGTADGNHIITSIVDGTHFTVNIEIAGTPTYTGGTYSAQYRMITLHGSGTPTGYGLSADALKFTPTLIYDPIFGGYYVDKFGMPKTVANGGLYRVIGFFHVNNVGVVDDMISFGQCKEKNDNYIESDSTGTAAVANGTPFRLAIPTRFTKLWGTDYIATDDVTNKFRIIAQTRLKYIFNLNTALVASSSTLCGVQLRKNGTIGKSVNISQGATGVNIESDPILSDSNIIDNGSYFDIRPGYTSATVPSINSLSCLFNLN